MNHDSKIFGIIVEWKEEGPLIMEGKPMSEEDARGRMREIARQANVIRVAVFSMDHADGNETLIEKAQA